MPILNIDVTERLEQLIERNVASGRYRDASEVVREGLRLLEQQEEEHTVRLERLRGEARTGFEALDRGDFVEVGAEELRDLVSDLGRQAAKRTKPRPPRS